MAESSGQLHFILKSQKELGDEHFLKSSSRSIAKPFPNPQKGLLTTISADRGIKSVNYSARHVHNFRLILFVWSR